MIRESLKLFDLAERLKERLHELLVCQAPCCDLIDAYEDWHSQKIYIFDAFCLEICKLYLYMELYLRNLVQELKLFEYIWMNKLQNDLLETLFAL